MSELLPFLAAGSPWAVLASVCLFYLRQITKDRDWYRERYEENNRALRVAVEELEVRPKLRVVRNGE